MRWEGSLHGCEPRRHLRITAILNPSPLRRNATNSHSSTRENVCFKWDHTFTSCKYLPKYKSRCTFYIIIVVLAEGEEQQIFNWLILVIYTYTHTRTHSLMVTPLVFIPFPATMTPIYSRLPYFSCVGTVKAAQLWQALRPAKTDAQETTEAV